MRNLIILAILFPSMAFASPKINETEVIRLFSNQAEYSVGDRAILRATLSTRPKDGFGFTLRGALNSQDLSIEKITDFEFFSEVKNLQAGTYDWAVTVYIQDKRLAEDLKSAIATFTAQIAAIDAELLTESDPQIIAGLEEEKARLEDLLLATEFELENNKTKVFGPATHQFIVQ